MVNPLVVAWASAGPEARRDFVRVCWSEIIQAREDQVMAANGNGADHWAQPSKGNAEHRIAGSKATAYDNTTRRPAR